MWHERLPIRSPVWATERKSHHLMCVYRNGIPSYDLHHGVVGQSSSSRTSLHNDWFALTSNDDLSSTWTCVHLELNPWSSPTSNLDLCSPTTVVLTRTCVHQGLVAFTLHHGLGTCLSLKIVGWVAQGLPLKEYLTVKGLSVDRVLLMYYGRDGSGRTHNEKSGHAWWERWEYLVEKGWGYNRGRRAGSGRMHGGKADGSRLHDLSNII